MALFKVLKRYCVRSAALRCALRGLKACVIGEKAEFYAAKCNKEGWICVLKWCPLYVATEVYI